MTTSNEQQQQIYEEIRREHEHLREVLGKIRHALNVRMEAATNLAEMMSSLQQHVSVHFHEEEEGGFFHEVVVQAPRMSNRADALKQEHVGLATAVVELVTIASEENELCKSLDTKFHDFSKTLMQHESKENELLLDAYDDDIGAAD